MLPVVTNFHSLSINKVILKLQQHIPHKLQLKAIPSLLKGDRLAGCSEQMACNWGFAVPKSTRSTKFRAAVILSAGYPSMTGPREVQNPRNHASSKPNLLGSNPSKPRHGTCTTHQPCKTTAQAQRSRAPASRPPRTLCSHGDSPTREI